MNSMRDVQHRKTFLAALLAAVGVLSLVGGQAGADDKLTEPALIEVLRSGPPAEKALACKHLATRGSKACVPELAKLLADAELASWARIALEAIPDPAADEALRNATPALKGKLLVGTINSIGVRQDAAAVELLAGLLKDQDAEAAAAAAVALGHVGNDAATKSLRGSLGAASPVVRSAVAEGCILCAERLVREERHKEAAELYDAVRQAEVPKPRKFEATRGAILARKTAGIPLLVEQLRSTDRGFVQIGLGTARELPGREVAEALAAEVAKASPDRAVLLLATIADRHDVDVLPAVLAAAKSGDKQVRIAALDVVGRLGDVAVVAPLVEVAGDADAELSAAAKAAIVALADKKVDADITSRLAAASGKQLPVLIELVGQRRINATAPVIKALDHSDAAVRSAALAALGATVSPKELHVLVSQAVAPKHSEDEQAAQRALREACLRMPDRDACAAELAASLGKASVPAQASVLETLGAMGGGKALATIADVMKNSDDRIQDAGSRVLGEWMTVDAGPVLLDQAKNAPADKYKVRALRGYIRLARQFAMPDAQRAEMCRQALAVSNRPDEQKLVLAVLERYPNQETLKVATKAAQTAALRDDASRVTLAIAKKIGVDEAKMKELLASLNVEPVKVDIVKAEYGSDKSQKDVTETLKKCVDGLPLIMLSSKRYNDSFGGDPAPGTPKILKVQYTINGKAGDASFPEDSLIVLPMPK